MKMTHFNGIGKNKDWRGEETFLRVIRGPVSSRPTQPKLEIVEGMAKYEGRTLFQTQIGSHDTLISEESCGPITTQIRFRQISTPPPPTLLSSQHLSNYLFVSTLEISCAVDVKWIFAFISCLPRIVLVRFGGSSFDGFIYLDKSQVKMPIRKSYTLEELHIRTNGTKPANPQANNALIESIDKILHFTAEYFPRLIRADFYLPRGTQLDRFLDSMPTLKDNGTEKKENFITGMVHFTTNMPNAVPSSYPNFPNPNKKLAPISEKGKMFKTSSYIPGICNDEKTQLCLFPAENEKRSIPGGRKCLKRTFTLDSESGQSNDDRETLVISESEDEDAVDNDKYPRDVKVFKADTKAMTNKITLKNIQDLLEVAAQEKESNETKIVVQNTLKTFSYSSKSSNDDNGSYGSDDDDGEIECIGTKAPGNCKVNYFKKDVEFSNQFIRRKHH